MTEKPQTIQFCSMIETLGEYWVFTLEDGQQIAVHMKQVFRAMTAEVDRRDELAED